MWVLAAAASFVFPGAGQALAGATRAAVIWVAVGVVLFVPALWWTPAMYLALLVHPVAAIDAAIRTDRHRMGRWPYDRAAIIAGVWIVALVGLRAFVIEAFKIPSTSMTPSLAIGDHVLVNKLATPGRGDIVVFRHPIGVDYVKRIVAVGGDTVAVRAGVLYVNGTAAAQRRRGPARYDDHDEVVDRWVEKQVDAYDEVLGGRTHVILRDPETPADGVYSQDYPAPSDPGAGEPCVGRWFGEEDATYRRAPMTPTPDGTACRVPPGALFMLGDNRDNANDSRSWGAIPADKVIGRVIGIWWSSTPYRGIRWSRIGNVD